MPDCSPITMLPASGTDGAGLSSPQTTKTIMPRAPSTTPTIVALVWVRMGSCNITASRRTSADCIRRRTN
ncbi:hypothetical protein GCM10027258_11930 [Amycolatopsis stemonae]